MSTNNVFAVTSIFKELDRKITLNKKEKVTVTEQELLDTYLNVTYPSLKRYADFYEFNFKFLKEIPFDICENIPIRKKIWYSKSYYIKKLFEQYDNIIMSDFDVIIKTYNNVLNRDEIGVIEKENVLHQYKREADFVSKKLNKQINRWYKTSFVYIPKTYKDVFIEQINEKFDEFLLDPDPVSTGDEVFINYIIHKHNLPVFKINKILKLNHYGGGMEKQKLIELNKEYFKFKKYFSYI